jgi:hypothetical protein
MDGREILVIVNQEGIKEKYENIIVIKVITNMFVYFNYNCKGILDCTYVVTVVIIFSPITEHSILYHDIDFLLSLNCFCSTSFPFTYVIPYHGVDF